MTPPSQALVYSRCSPASRKPFGVGPRSGKKLMAEIKFSCPQCGQHVSGNDQWAGHQIQCPACAATITVPQAAAASAAAAAPAHQSLVPQPPASHGARLSAGATQVKRSATPGPMPSRPNPARPPRTNSPLLKYAVYAVVLAALGGAGYMVVPSMISKIQDSANSKPTQAEPASSGGGAGSLGEVNGAMDVSDAMEGGSSSRTRPATARKPGAAQTPAAPAVRATNAVSRAK